MLGRSFLSQGKVVALLACLAFAARAESGLGQGSSMYEPPRWALGLSLGEPTGLSIKRYLGGRNAFDLNLDAVYGPGLRFGADYLWGLAQLLSDRSSLNLDVYLGLGAFVGALRGPCGGFYNWRGDCSGDGYVGGRIPLGIEALFRTAPLSVGLEVAPGIAFASGHSGFLLDASLMLRLLL